MTLYSLKNYRLGWRKSKPRSHFTLTPFADAPYLETFCPNCDGTVLKRG
jgi:hypothetical protein